MTIMTCNNELLSHIMLTWEKEIVEKKCCEKVNENVDISFSAHATFVE